MIPQENTRYHGCITINWTHDVPWRYYGMTRNAWVTASALFSSCNQFLESRRDPPPREPPTLELALVGDTTQVDPLQECSGTSYTRYVYNRSTQDVCACANCAKAGWGGSRWRYVVRCASCRLLAPESPVAFLPPVPLPWYVGPVSFETAASQHGWKNKGTMCPNCYNSLSPTQGL